MESLNIIFDIIRDVLENEDLVLSEDSNVDNVEGWDSLAHVRIILAVETEFDVRFPVEDIPSLTSVSKLLQALQAK